MLYQDKKFYLCHVPLDASGPGDVVVMDKADKTADFTGLFNKYEELRSHACNEDGLYSVVRASDIYVLIRTISPSEARIGAFEEAVPGLITNLEHRVMQQGDQEALKLLQNVHGVELNLR